MPGKFLRSVLIGLIVGGLLLAVMPSLRQWQLSTTTQYDSADESPASYNSAVRRAAPAVVNVYNRALNGTSHNQLTLGSGAFIPGFEDQLIGCKAGDEKDVVVTFPKEYHAEELAGKEATFKCKVHKVEETILPEIDDEFAKDVSDTCETLDDLKKEITERLKAERQEAADNAFEEKVLDAVIDGMKADIPAAMIDSQVDTIVQDFGYRLQMQGMGLEQYLKMTNTEMGAFRAMFKDQAERQVKTRLALQKVADQENITVSEQEIADEYAKMAEQYKMDVEKIKTIVAESALSGDLRISNALEFIKKNAKVKKASKKKAEETEETEETAE